MKTFYFVDVFATQKYAGNQLAVVPDAGDIEVHRMQQLAREFNFSETTFVVGGSDEGGFDVRIFTPDREIPFAGHPTLGTAYIIREKVLRRPVEAVTLNLKAGRVPVSFGSGNPGSDDIWMKQLPPQFLKQHGPDQVAPVLGLTSSQIDDRFPIEEVSTGTPFFIVPLRSLAAQRAIRVNLAENARLVEANQSKAILTFCAETAGDNVALNVRVFAHWYGVAEDPATGSAAGCLAGYLARHRYFGKDQIDIAVEEGLEIGRPSLLRLKASEAGTGIEVRVGGRVIEVAEGRLI